MMPETFQPPSATAATPAVEMAVAFAERKLIGKALLVVEGAVEVHWSVVSALVDEEVAVPPSSPLM